MRATNDQVRERACELAEVFGKLSYPSEKVIPWS